MYRSQEFKVKKMHKSVQHISDMRLQKGIHELNFFKYFFFKYKIIFTSIITFIITHFITEYKNNVNF